MKMIVLTGLPTMEKALLTRDLATHYLSTGERVTVLDNANVHGELSDVAAEVVKLRGGCACCSVAGKLYATAEDLGATADVVIMAADSQTHVGNLIVVLEEFARGISVPVDLTIAALVDERTTCCFPYVAETLEDAADVTLQAPFDVDLLLNALEG
jgi:hypothetical protein